MFNTTNKEKIMSSILAVAFAMTVATAIVCPQSISWAANTVAKKVNDIYMDAKMQEISKRQAARILLANSKEKVLRCYEVEMTDKLTLKKRK